MFRLQSPLHRSRHGFAHDLLRDVEREEAANVPKHDPYRCLIKGNVFLQMVPWMELLFGSSFTGHIFENAMESAVTIEHGIQSYYGNPPFVGSILPITVQ
jgi:hypothetical protein